MLCPLGTTDLSRTPSLLAGHHSQVAGPLCWQERLIWGGGGAGNMVGMEKGKYLKEGGGPPGDPRIVL